MILCQWGVDPEHGVLCAQCAPENVHEDGLLAMAAWCRVAPVKICAKCGKDACEQIKHSQIGLEMADRERPATSAELRKMGYGYADDVSCDWCGLFTFGGAFPLHGDGLCAECAIEGEE